MTFVWFDVWDSDDSLADRFPALRSHHDETMHHVALNGLATHLLPRLTATAGPRYEPAIVNALATVTAISRGVVG